MDLETSFLASAEPIFTSRADYRSGISRAQDAMKKDGIDLHVLHGSANHHIRPIFLILLPDGEPAFVSPRIEVPIIRKKWSEEVVAEWGDWEELGMPGSFWDAIASHMRKVVPQGIRDVSDMIGLVRRHNDVATIRILSLCADIAVHKLLSIQKAIAPGDDENHSPLGSSFTVMGGGRNRLAHAHSIAAGRIMGEGEAASAAAWKTVRPGMTAGQVHAAAADVIISNGYEKGLQHGTGRSIGCGECDVIGIEPGVYEVGVGGARYGDTGRVVGTGFEMLTPFDLGRDI
ncbi:hypothetical protein B0J13DRAFT_589818 [Dactylonectria estremocensis]|uniref:Peptidase M24 domain-containing protein n=1 Tax=Dactylonectria estremocensis TaxID=1079267 RepID=A0A9P9DJQ4_9HYPO|nr:hypothetical protein B0J13DRAFT_589818 [Dactylonectria estremocensis]